MTTTDEIRWRFYGDPVSALGQVSLCVHLREELDDQLGQAIKLGAKLKLTKADAIRLRIETLMPVDLSEDEKFRFAEQFTKMFFYARGTRKCEACGHIARGKLAQATAEEKQRWYAELSAAEDDLADMIGPPADNAIDEAVKASMRPKKP